jgi:hypothetical protein
MRRLRTRKTLVLFGIGVVVFAAFLPVGSLFEAILTPLWVVLPAAAVVLVRRQAVRCDEQPVSLLALLSSRAPPVALTVA